MPTTVRAAGVGSSSLVSKVGGTLSTTVAALAEISPIIPTLIFGSMAITSGLITFILPETKDRPMPATIDDVANVQFCGKVGDRKGKHPAVVNNDTEKVPGLHVSPSQVSLG